MSILLKNRKAWFDYFIEEELEAGIKLEGWEVKAIRAKQFKLVGSHVVIKQGKVTVIGMRIDPLESASTHVKPDPERTRELLLHKEEIKSLIGKIEQRGWTIVPLSLNLAHGLVKVKLGLARGKKQHDKKNTIKNRDQERELDRDIKGINA